MTETRGRVLAIHRHYWPDSPPYASLLRAIAAQWSEDGYQVDVLAGQPSYTSGARATHQPVRSQVDQSTVLRMPVCADRSSHALKLFNAGWFPLLAALRVVCGPRYDVVMCSTVPPVVLASWVSRAARMRGARFVYHCMDLHPEIGALSGEFSRPLPYRLLRRIDTTTCRRATAVVVLSEDMRRALLDRDPALADRLVVLNNFEIPDFEAADPAEEPPLRTKDDRLRVVFTGNLGRFQALETVVAGVLRDDPRLASMELVLMGEGAVLPRIRRLLEQAPTHAAERVRLLPHGSPGQARAMIRTADLGLVSLMPQVIRYAYPSKTATYLSEGLPLLVAVERDSQLARQVVEEGVGIHLPLSGPEQVADTMAHWAVRRDELTAMRARARTVWAEHFCQQALLPRWSSLLNDRVGR